MSNRRMTMRLFPRISFAIVAIMWLVPPLTIADAVNESTVTQKAQPQSGSAPTKPASKENAVKKPNQADVQSRGLFSKKKKKQVGGSAGHSQPAEQTDAPPH